jgi:A/G-specific adenine glycosylase
MEKGAYLVESKKHRDFDAVLMKWHRANRMDFSFRRTIDPYQILVSEILLRKTTGRQVDRVFPSFVKKFPTPEALASAERRDIENLIAELGLRKRAAELQKMAECLVERYAGKVPSTDEDLRSLPGVGRYTAGAVLTFGFGQIRPMVDTNVVRVLSRVFGLTSAKKRPRTDERFWKRYESLIPPENPREFHHAVLDLARLVCLPKNPHCMKCPVSDMCEYASREAKRGFIKKAPENHVG